MYFTKCNVLVSSCYLTQIRVSLYCHFLNTHNQRLYCYKLQILSGRFMYRLFLCFLLYPCSLYGQNIHEKIIDEIGIRTEEGQNALIQQFLRHSLSHPQTLRANFDESLSVITIVPRVSDHMFRTYQPMELLKKILKSNGQVCDAPFIKALTSNGFAFAVKVDLPADIAKRTPNEIRFMPYTKELVRRHPPYFLIGKPLDANFWCAQFRSEERNYNSLVLDPIIYPFQDEHWSEKQWLIQECIYNIDRELYNEEDITKGMRSTEHVEQKMQAARLNVYINCKKGKGQFVWDYIKSLFD